MTVADFALAVSVIGKKYKGSVTSWGRTTKHAIAVGGFDGDPHTWWLGADLVYDDIPGKGLDADAHALGLKVIHEGSHDHLQPLDFPPGKVTQYPCPTSTSSS